MFLLCIMGIRDRILPHVHELMNLCKVKQQKQRLCIVWFQVLSLYRAHWTKAARLDPAGSDSSIFSFNWLVLRMYYILRKPHVRNWGRGLLVYMSPPDSAGHWRLGQGGWWPDGPWTLAYVVHDCYHKSFRLTYEHCRRNTASVWVKRWIPVADNMWTMSE